MHVVSSMWAMANPGWHSAHVDPLPIRPCGQGVQILVAGDKKCPTGQMFVFSVQLVLPAADTNPTGHDRHSSPSAAR